MIRVRPDNPADADKAGCTVTTWRTSGWNFVDVEYHVPHTTIIIESEPGFNPFDLNPPPLSDAELDDLPF